MIIYQLDGNRIRSTSEEGLDDKKTTWIRSIAPDEEELQTLSRLSGVPLKEFKESLEEEERPRLTKTKRYLELIYDSPHMFEKEGLQTLELYFYLSGNLIITIEGEKNKVLDKLEKKCSQNRVKFIFKSPGSFLFHALDEVNDEYFFIIEKIASGFEAFKAKDLSNVSLSNLYATSITSAYFNRAVIANLEALNQLKKCHFRSFSATDRENFSELHIDKMQILDTQKIQHEIIMNMIDIQTIISTEKLNKTMKRLTALALLIAVPTLISSIYGMNIELPFSDSPHAFLILMCICVFSVLFLFMLMKQLDWL